MGRPLKTRFFPRLVAVDVKDEEGGFDGKVVKQFFGGTPSRVCERTAGAGAAHPVNVCVHLRPIEAETDAMECAGDIEVPSNGIAVERHKDDVAEG